MSVNTSSSGAGTSQPHNVARRSSEVQELLCPKVAAWFLMEDVNKSFSQCVGSAQPQVIHNLRDQYTAQ